MLHLPRIIDSKPQSRRKQYATRVPAYFRRGTVCRVLSVLLVLSILTASTPGAPRAVVETSQQVGTDISFWLKANYVLPKLWNLITQQNKKPKPEQSQSDRDAKVRRIEILPGDVTVQEGQQVNFTAVAYDAENNSVGGVKIDWKTQDEDRNNADAGAAPRGTFTAHKHGNFKVIAEAAGQTTSVKVKVVEGKHPKKDDKPIEVRTSSSRDLPPEEQAKKEKSKSGSSGAGRASGMKLAHAAKAPSKSAPAAPYFIAPEWGPDNYWSADDPGNTTGDPPGTPSDGGAGSGNFQLSAPVLALAGRGMDIPLALSYNSRLWNKAGSNITYDIDRDWPAPGWSLGFGKLVGLGVYIGGMIIEADGTRHSYTGNITIYNWGTYFTGHTTDGSFIDYTYWSGTGGAITSATATYPNGTTIYYNVQGTGAVYPSMILDANGNYITISYVNNQGPRIHTIVDTTGRAITFHYDSLNRLTAICAPALSSGTRTLVRLHYTQLALSYSFSGLTANVRDSYPYVIDAIYFPSSGSGYWFDTYSTYGMLKKISERRGMTFSGPAPVPPGQSTDQGTITAGQATREEVYNYPLNTGDTSGTQASGLTDAPTYTSATETWTRDGTNFDSATTTYEVHLNTSPRTVKITLPNGTSTTQSSYNSPGSYLDGLVYLDETKLGTTVLQSSSSQWAQGAYESVRPTSITTTNELGQSTNTQYSYGSVYNQVTDVRNYDYSGALLKSTRTTYQNSSLYTSSRHIFNLPLTVEVYAGDNVTRVSRTDYQYDGQAMVAAPGVVQHDQSYNPYADAEGFCYWDFDWNDPDCTGGCWDYNCDGYCPQYYVCPYNGTTDYRGNVTQVTTYADAAGLTGAVTETRQYDVTGNMVVSSNSCCQQSTNTFSVSNQYAYPVSQTRGSPTDALNQITTSSTYDFNTGLMLSSTDPNGRVSQTTYDTTSLRPVTASAASGAHTDYSYDDANLTLTETTYLESHPTHTTIANQNVKVLNGRGQIRQEQALGVGGVWDYVDTVFDSSGRVTQQSRPYRSGDTIRWNTSVYDGLSRVTSTTAPDGSVVQTFYNESNRPSAASSTAGDTARVVDPWGRERWGRTDALGRLVEVVEPDQNGSGSVASNGMATTYGYDTLGNLTSVTQGSQTRSFKYDSLGRLVAQKLAEANATLNDAGTYVGSGTWSDVFAYDTRSNLTSRTDARGVKTVYTYNNDPFNRLQSISYDTTGFGDTANPILSAASVSYTYRTKSTGSELKDITQLATTTTSGISTESLSYDTEGRVSSKTSTLTSRPSYPFVTDYIYDALDRTTDVRYPAEYGNGSQLRKLVHNNYDVASRLSSLTVDGASHASNITYNASSQATSLNVGASGANQITESYGYNSVTGLLESQTVTRGASTLLNLGYNFADGNGKRSGQLVSISNNLDHNKDRGYEYDSLGRLKRATSGQNVNWAQRYYYDRYGNRNNVYSFTADQYVRNFYQMALARQPNSTELNSWLSTLQTAYVQGPTQFLTAMQNLGGSIFTSQEYLNRNRSDHDYVYDLYKAYLFRDPDASGWTFWEQGCAQNGRAAVRAGFDWSLEYNIKVGGTSPYSPPGGATVPRDGLSDQGFDSTNNHVANTGWYYDAAGNQTRVSNGTSWERFQYDAANRLVKVKADDNVTVLATYTYGNSKQRLIAEEAGQRTYFSADDGAVLAEYTESGAGTIPYWSKSYVYMGARLLSTLSPNGGGGANVEYHHPDRLGTRVVSNAQNTSSFEQVTLPFGTALSSESTGMTNRRFTTYERSTTTGLDYAVNRHYDSQQGRFTQVDPIGMKASSLEHPQTLNLYAYVANDPVNRTDPDGLFWGALKRFFKKLGKIFSAVAGAVSRVLNNRWVRIAMFALDFIMPGLGRLTSAFGKALTAALKLGLKIYGKIADVVSALQLAGMALQGQWKNFLTSVGLGIVSGMLSQITDGIKKGMQKALWPDDKNIKFDELSDLFAGAWRGLKDGWKKFKATVAHAFKDFPKNLVPWYGNYCSPAATADGNPKGGLIGDGMSTYDEAVCHVHDVENAGSDKAGADWNFVKHAVFGFGDPNVTSFDIAFSGQYGGRPLIGSVHKFFSVPIFIVRGTYRSLKK